MSKVWPFSIVFTRLSISFVDYYKAGWYEQLLFSISLFLVVGVMPQHAGVITGRST